jgi:hypothetical protein
MQATYRQLLLLSKIYTMRYIAVFSLLLLLGCQKEETFVPVELPKPEVPKAPITLEVSHTFGSSSLVFDLMNYTSAADYKLSVSDVKYYLSRFEVEDAEGTTHQMGDYLFVDARKPGKFEGKLPEGISARKLKFIIGFNKEDNRHEYLPNTVENFNMIWPEQMGGGYHFLKFEGKYTTGDGAQRGFALHLGENGYEVYVELPVQATINKEGHHIKLNMDVHNWLQNPITYDFEKDGNYSMGIAENMLKLTKNGQDVLTLVSFK